MAQFSTRLERVKTWYEPLQLLLDDARQEALFKLVFAWTRQHQLSDPSLAGSHLEWLRTCVQDFMAKFADRLWPNEFEKRQHLIPDANLVYSWERKSVGTDESPPLFQAVRMYFEQVMHNADLETDDDPDLKAAAQENIDILFEHVIDAPDTPVPADPLGAYFS